MGTAPRYMLCIPDRCHVCRQKREAAAAAHQQFCSKYGDHLTAVNLYRAYGTLQPKQRSVWCQEHFVNARALQKANDILDQLHQQLLDLKLPITSAGTQVEPVLKALVAGLFTNAAKRQADGELTCYIHQKETLQRILY